MEKQTTFWALFILALAVGGLIGTSFFRGSSSSQVLTGEATSSLGDTCVFVDAYTPPGNSLSGTPLSKVCDKINTPFTRFKYKTVAYQRTKSTTYFSSNDCNQSSFMLNIQLLSTLQTPSGVIHNGSLFDYETTTGCQAGGGNGVNEYYRADNDMFDGVLCCES